MQRCIAKLNYDSNKVLLVDTAKEIQQDEEFYFEFPIKFHKPVLKYSLKFVPLDSPEDDSKSI